MPTLSFGYFGGDTLEGPSKSTATAGNATLMKFNNNGYIVGTNLTILAVVARSFNDGPWSPGRELKPPAAITSWARTRTRSLEFRP